MAATRTGPAGVVRRDRDQVPAGPGGLVVQLPAKLEPALVEDRAVQAGLGPNPGARRFGGPGRGGGHVAHMQVLDTHHRVVLANGSCGLVQVVAPGVADAGMDALDLGFRLLPVVAELLLAAHGALRLGQRLLVALEAVEGREDGAIAQGGEAHDAEVDTDRRTLVEGDLDLALGLDRGEPFAVGLADRDVLRGAQHLAAVAVAQPAELGQEQAAIRLVELELLRIGIAEAVLRAALLLEPRKVGALGEEVGIGPLQVLEGLLQRMYRGLREPRRFRAIAPFGEGFAEPGIPEILVTGRKPLLLHR